MSARGEHPTCDMVRDCAAPVTHIDEKGFVYDGAIFKPAGWKGPEMNFPRGNVRDGGGSKALVPDGGSVWTAA